VTGARASIVLAVAMLLLAGGGALLLLRDDGSGTPAAEGAPAGSTLLLEGPGIFAAKGCIGCHVAPDAETGAPVGPSLRGIRDRVCARREAPRGREYVRESILDPGAEIAAGYGDGPFDAMPVLAVSEAEVELLVDYLMSPAPGEGAAACVPGA
jgi:cytochrome c oxidase subunit 2